MTDYMGWEKVNQNKWNISQDITGNILPYKKKITLLLHQLEQSARVNVIYKYLLNH